MAWIKRNLALVISGAIALALLVFGALYLLGAKNKNSTVDEEINQAKAELDRLMNLAPFPSPSNVTFARQELERVNAFIAQAKKQFPAPPPAERLTDQSFKSVLQTTIDDLHKQAQASGVNVETNYYFSFEAQRRPVTFPPESLQPLSARLREVHAVASVLIKSKVNRIEAVKRAPVPGEATQGPDYLAELPRTNSEVQAIIFPYEFTFQAFTPELATVVESIASMPEAMIIRSIVVEPAEAVAAPQRPTQPAPAQQPTRAVPGARRPVAAGPAQPGLETVLNERALRVIMKIDVINPLPK